MEENNKVIIFEKKEIVLISLLVVILIVTSFTIGVKMGKRISLDTSGVTKEDKKTVQLKSTVEEDAEKTLSADAQLTDEEKLHKLMDESKNKLSDELQKFSSEENKAAPATTSAEAPAQPANPMAGKYTIQLGSYNTVEEAKQFAEGFTVRGYSPIINEVKIEGKGTWYRVSLGAFDTVEAAKKYIRDEKSLFAGQDHVITEIK
ncbi:MAG: SPOR domain-containing protein [Bacteriovoracaceae bacterium]